jgi:general nucleoside transport system permease protein
MAEQDDATPTVAGRLALAQRAGGLIGPLLTAVFALLIGGLVVLATGANPLSTYRAIFDGSGLNWLFPWVTGIDRSFAATNLQQTLLLTTALVLCGLAVSVGFRCGLFNIGGQGQYIVGSIFALWIGSSFVTLNGPLHIVLTIGAATLAGAAYAGIAGLLKALTGAHEVISTIMLNWIAVWVGSWLVGQGGALQSHANGGSTPISNPVASSTHLHVFWGNPALQGLDVGFFFALVGLVVYAIVLNRTTLGFELRAVGFNPEAARYAGIGVARTYVTTMAIAGAFAGLAGAIDVLGWEFQLGVTDIQTSQIGFIAIAVAVLGRNRALGVFFSALLFGALLTGTSTRNLDATVFRPDLAGNLTLIIQGLVVLFVGADVLILWLWNRRRRLRVAT